MSRETGLALRIKALHVAVDHMSTRERVLVFATTILLLASVWYLLLMQPLVKEAGQKRTEIATIQSRIATSSRAFEDQVLQMTGSGTEYESRFARVQRRLDEVNERLDDYASELIDPAEMARVLEGMLKEKSGLQLVRIRNLVPEALSASADSRTATFYKHGLEIEFEGSYFACLEYLHAIETLPWRFYWQILDLEVIEYPTNRVRVEVSTLSLDKEWIGA
ncbi:MAG: type II secretion system protein M [Gammaproteobacteria bacterium]|nr:type II secretion system protein M [Gammaproteobacteria bacterium]